MSPGVTASLRALAALLIALIFISVLMTASAQQEVMKQLAGIDATLDYSTAYATKLRVDQANLDARTAAANEQAANQAVSKASDAADSAVSDFEDAWQSALPQIQQLIRTNKCNLDSKAVASTEDGQHGQVVGDIQNCAAGSAIVDANAKDGLEQTYHAMLNANGQLNAAKLHQLRAQADSKALVAQDEKAQRISNSFNITNKLRGSWYLGGNALIDYPPALLQILLSFVSGTFGALLITLVLIVYPNSPFTITASAGYGARILLGGLIALCVYVVLNGGSAVLGNVTTVTAGSTNYMTFCAIGILAGMFSDRVAAWLSDRANSFFRNVGNGGGGTGTGVGGGGMPPPAGSPSGTQKT